MKKTSSLIAAFTLFTFVVPTIASAASPFVDIPEDFEFVQALDSLKTRGVIKGYPDQTFLPDKGISRAEFLKLAVTASGVKVPVNSAGETGTLEDISFTDVSKDDWFYDLVRTAKTLRLVSGYSDNTFRPQQGVSRVEALKILSNAYGVTPDTSAISSSAAQTEMIPSDLPVGGWFTPYAQFARNKWIMTDYDDGKFRPHQQLTRASAAEIVYRFDRVVAAKMAAFDITSEWSTHTSTTGSFTLKMPRNWSVIPESTRTVFWKEDPTIEQEDYAFTTPLSAKLIVRHPVSITQTTATAYFTEIRKLSETLFGKDSVNFEELGTTLHVTVKSKNLENWYIFVEPKKAVVLYGEFGDSPLTSKMRDILRLMERSLVYSPSPLAESKKAEIENLLSQIHTATLVEGKGTVTLSLLTDKVLFETDTIGVGTGPIDYYFSPSLNVTVKYERKSDVILSIRSGRTSKF
jgi:hypothetical protein